MDHPFFDLSAGDSPVVIGNASTNDDPNQLKFYNAPDYGPFVYNVYGGGPNPNEQAYGMVGYNMTWTPDTNWHLIDPDEPAWFLGFETHYIDGSGDHNMEWYLQYHYLQGPGGAGDVHYLRPIMVQVDRNTNLPTGTQISAGPVYGVDININDGTGTDNEKVIGKQKLNVGATMVRGYVPFYSQYGIGLGSNASTGVTGVLLNLADDFTNLENTASVSLSIQQIATSAITNAAAIRYTPIFSAQAVKMANTYAFQMNGYVKPQMAASGNVAHDFFASQSIKNSIYTGATLGTITNLMGLNVQSPTNEATGNTVIFTRGDGVRIENQGTVGGNAGGTVNSARGLVVADQSGGSLGSIGILLGTTGNPANGLWAFYNNSANTNLLAGKTYMGAAITSVANATSKVTIAAGSATANTAPLGLTGGTSETAARSGTVQFSSASASGIQTPSGTRFTLTESDTTERYIVQAATSAKTTAAAPYTNDGYVTMTINGTAVKVMTTA